MKKLIASLAVVSALFAAGSACATDSGRWEYIGENNAKHIQYYVDTQSITYSPASDIAKAWLRQNRTDIEEYAVSQFTINFSAWTVKDGDETYVYNSTGSQTFKNTSAFSPIIPGSVGETVANYVQKKVNRDEKRAAYKKEQKDKKADAEREKTVKKGVNLLRGAFGL